MKRLLPLAFACLCFAAVVAVPVAGAKSSKSSKPYSAADEQYLKTSMQGDLFEVIGGKWAQGHTKNGPVLRMANTLVSDHTKSYAETAALARSLGVDVPTAPTASEEWELRMVASLHGKAYDHWYASLEAYDHVQDISEATDEVKDGMNAKVRDDARTELPMLRMHLRLAREALAANRTA